MRSFKILLPTVSFKETLPQPPTVPMAPRRAETAGTVPMHFRGDEGHPQPSLSENMTGCLGQTCHAMSRNVLLNTKYMYIHGIRFCFAGPPTLEIIPFTCKSIRNTYVKHSP